MNVDQEKKEKKNRIFVGLPLSEELQKHLKKTFIDLPGKRTLPSQWHITLQFLGNVEEDKIKILDERLRKLIFGAPFQITLGQVEAIPHVRSAKALWLTLTKGKEVLESLFKTLNNLLIELDFTLEERSFAPHVTLSRIKPRDNVYRWMQNLNFTPISMEVREIILYQSVQEIGYSRYIALFSYKLSKRQD